MSRLSRVVREFCVEIGLVLLIAVLILAAVDAVRARDLEYPYPKRGQCAAGYIESGGYCRPGSPNARRSFPKGPGQCPSGYAQSGGSCQEIR